MRWRQRLRRAFEGLFEVQGMAVVVDRKSVSIAVVVEVIDLFKKAAEFVGALDKAIAVDISLNKFVFCVVDISLSRRRSATSIFLLENCSTN